MSDMEIDTTNDLAPAEPDDVIDENELDDVAGGGSGGNDTSDPIRGTGGRSG